MKQVILDLKSGAITVEEVPVPAIKKGVIVRNHYSLISAGTESSLIHLAEESLIGKAKARPDLFNKVVNKIKTDGILSAYEQAMSRLEKPEPLGYSCAGVVVESCVDEFKVGDRVACSGAGFANHAEYNYIPKNLCVHVPVSVDLKNASFMTIGAIAMQGVRNAHISVGEKVVVTGLGLVGLITIQILKAAGCRVFGIDIDNKKMQLALNLGADCVSTSENALEVLKSFSEFGADAVIITAATKSNAPIIQAGDLVREKGRVVVIGDVGLNVPRNSYYAKEAELVVSKSYGPGRYDRLYEEKGIDYPLAIRWTEKRNMQAFIDLIEQKKIYLDTIITHEFSIEQSPEAYNLIKTGKEPYIGILLKYDTGPAEIIKKNVVHISSSSGNSRPNGKISIGLIGAGIQATSALLPNLVKLPLTLKGVATSTGLSAQSVAKRFGFEYCSTDYHELLQDPSIDAVIIATRNDTHAQIAIEAINAGKDVFVEKPLATSVEELKELVDTWKSHNQCVQVGFNRRYSPLTQKLKSFFAYRHTPLVMHYRINSGHIPGDHWVHDEEQGGSMLISECCHFIDYLQYIAGSTPVKVFTSSIQTSNSDINIQENLQIHITYLDGSIGTVTYTTIGDGSYSKEMVEIFGNQSVGIIKDFREINLVHNGKTQREKKWLRPEKGFYEELQRFYVGNEDEFESAVFSTFTTLNSLKSLKTGSSELLDLTEIGL